MKEPSLPTTLVERVDSLRVERYPISRNAAVTTIVAERLAVLETEPKGAA